jgi:hypothetical protein
VLLRLLKIRGQSLAPVYREGDYVLISRLPLLLGGLRCGDTVVFHHPRLGKLIKLVEWLEDAGQAVFVIGLDADSVDSRRFGPVQRDNLLGKVIWHIPKK